MPSQRSAFDSTSLLTARGLSAVDTIAVSDADDAAGGRADDDGMAYVEPSVPAGSATVSRALFDELGQLTTRGGERDQASWRRFESVAAKLRSGPNATGAFRAKVASAAGWAGLLFSSWRHLKYDGPSVNGAERVRAFIRRDLHDARGMKGLDGALLDDAPASR
jgi:hypothetical protein